MAKFEREAYERSLLLITEFEQDDVITTSAPTLDIPDEDDRTDVMHRVFQTH